MNREIIIIANGLLAVTIFGCSRPVHHARGRWSRVELPGTGTFSSNGERIYFTTTSERVIAIDYTGGPASNGWMMCGGGRLAVEEGKDLDGTQLNTDMPRWDLGNDDLADLIVYLKTLSKHGRLLDGNRHWYSYYSKPALRASRPENHGRAQGRKLWCADTDRREGHVDGEDVVEGEYSEI